MYLLKVEVFWRQVALAFLGSAYAYSFEVLSLTLSTHLECFMMFCLPQVQ